MSGQCGETLNGRPCVLEEGHEGLHFKPWPHMDGGMRWSSDPEDARVADRNSSRFD